MRISSSRIQKEDTASNDMLKSDPNNLSETLNPTEDTMGGTYTILLPDKQPEKKVWFLSTNLLIIISIEINCFLLSEEERNCFCVKITHFNNVYVFLAGFVPK